jgi:hypothetical protein
VVFVATSGGNVRLWRRRLDDERGAPIAGTEGARAPSWRADGQALAFFAGGALKQLTLATGEIRELAPAREPGGAAWLDDGSLVFSAAANAPLMKLGPGGPAPATSLQPGDRAHMWPSRTPRGVLYVALRDDGRRIIRLDAGATTHDLGTTDGHAQLVADVLLHVRGGALLAQRVVAGDTGRATVVATNVGAVNGRGSFTASPRLLLVSAATTRARELVWLDARGVRGPAASDRGDYWQVRLAPDDRAAAVTMLEPQLRTLDVFVFPLASQGLATGLTLALAADTDPVWSPDGRRVLFRSLQDGQPRLYSRVAHQVGAPIEPVPGPVGNSVPTDWGLGPRGEDEVLYHAATARPDTDLMLLDPGSGTSRPVAGSGFNESDGRWSPDGRTLAYVSDEFGQPDVFVQTWPSGGRARVTVAGGTKPRWGPDGRTLYLLRGEDIAHVNVSPGATPSVSVPAEVARTPGIRDFDVAHGGRRLLAILPARETRPIDARALVDWQTLVPRP